MSHRWARRWGRRLAAGAVLLAAATLPAAAQQRTIVLRNGESPFEIEVDRLVHELLQKRRIAVALVSNVEQLQEALRSVQYSDDQRVAVERSLRELRTRLVSLESDGARIRSRLNNICDADRQPDGWVGIAYSGTANATREQDGRVIMRFVDYPSVESVEPGSPADKAGIRGGDRIMAMAGKDLRDAQIDFTPLLKPGTRIPFKVQRGTQSRMFGVLVEPRPQDFTMPCPWVDERIAAAFAPSQMMVTVTTDDVASTPAVAGGARVILRRQSGEPPAPPAPPAVAPVPPVPPLSPIVVGGSASAIVFGGAQFMAVSPELAEALGVERGLLLTGMGRGSPAEQSGLRTGDVLISVDGRPLVSPVVFLQAVEGSTRRELRLQLIRKRKTMTATLKW